MSLPLTLSEVPTKTGNGFATIPVVIVGKDRTRMTCAVIDHLKAHIKNAKPYFICVSDRSRNGHDKVVENHLRTIGEEKFEVLRTLPEENRYGWGAAINIGLECAFDVCKESICALVVDNDWLLQRDLDVDKYLYAFAYSDIGAITFKPVHGGTNVSLEEIRLSDGSLYTKRSPVHENKRFSFTAELGCTLITRSMYETYGKFKENCVTDQTEWGFCNWYNALAGKERTEKHIWFATDKEMFHEELNGKNHVFTHVGINSQHPGPQKWICPEEYKYLSDDKADEQVCKVAVMNSLLRLDEQAEPSHEGQIEFDHTKSSEEGFWTRHKVLFATNFMESPSCPLRLSYDILKRIAGEGEVYISPPNKFGKEAFLDIFSYAKRNGYDYVVYADADCFIVSEPNLRAEFERFLQRSNAALAGASDGGMFFHRNGNPWAINPFLLFVRLSKIPDFILAGDWTKDFSAEEHVRTETRISWNEAVVAFREWRSRHGVVPMANELSCTTSPYVLFWFGRQHSVYKSDEENLRKEPYYDIFIGMQRDVSSEFMFMYGGDYAFQADPSGICSAIFHFGDGERDYSDESRLICVHTWFARAYLKTPDTGNDDLRAWQTRRIEKVVSWVRQRISQQSEYNIDWGKYFDKVYVQFFCSNGFSRLPRLKDELRRIDLLDSPVLEWDYGTSCAHDKEVFESNYGNYLYTVNYTNHALQLLRELKRAKAFGYRRILILEDDVAFLRDKTLIVDILESLPEDCDLVQLDKFMPEEMHPVYKASFANSNPCSKFVDVGELPIPSAAANVYNSSGIDKAIDALEARLVSCDRIPVHRKVSVKNLCVQVLYSDAQTQVRDVSEFHDLYRRLGIDELYSEYSVPVGYDMHSAYDEQTVSAYQDKRSPRKFVSVYAIAKNEASVAKRWYECVKEADEVCVLDTGSTDDTVKILRDLGAKVTVKTYADWSFAVARNDSMNLVSPDADILFTLDLDETIAPGWRKRLEDAWAAEEKKGNEPKGVVYKYIWSFFPDGKEAQSFSINKIHANGTGQWKYRCHELLCGVDGYRFFLPDFVVEHHQNRQTNRSKYLPLLEKDAREMPGDDRSAYYYARELMYAGQWRESLDEFKRHLSLPTARWPAERASSMRNIATCYGHLGDKELCELWLRKSADEDPTNREASFRLGEIELEQKNYPAAVAAFRRCVAVEKPSPEYITMPIVWSARPWFLYAQALWWTGDWKCAEEASRKALEIEPHNPEVISQYQGMSATRKQYNR